MEKLHQYALKEEEDQRYKDNLFSGQFKKIIGDYDSIVGALEVNDVN